MTTFKIGSYCVTVVLLVSGVQGQWSCLTPDGASGVCISIRSCAPLLSILQDRNRTPQQVEHIRNSQCGYENNNPLVDTSPVCCPGCQTPDGRAGSCVEVNACPAITRLLVPPISSNVLEFVQKSRCRSSGQYSVCCGFDNQVKVPVTTTTEALPPNRGCISGATPPDPNTECCGLDGASGNKIFGGTHAAIDQYPWLIIIEYRGVRDNKIKLLCGGSLISGRYVITAAHCVTGPVMSVGTPINVRVGDYDTRNSGRDCVPVEGGGEDCTDGEEVIPIEEIIPHEDYDSKSSLRRHDIALIRLKKLAPYTDFIRPICLPNNDIGLVQNKQTLYAAGWGAVSEYQSSSALKLHVDLPLVKVEECQPSYNVSQRKVILWDGQICAGGEKGKDSCKGDSGGPLMYDNGRLYSIVGVVSFGPTPCGIEDVPGVYTKVFAYLPWIHSKIKP